MQRGIFKIFIQTLLNFSWLVGFSWNGNKEIRQKNISKTDWPTTLAIWRAARAWKRPTFSPAVWHSRSSVSYWLQHIHITTHSWKWMASTNIHTILTINNNTEVREAAFVCEISLGKKKKKSLEDDGAWWMLVLRRLLRMRGAVKGPVCPEYRTGFISGFLRL